MKFRYLIYLALFGLLAGVASAQSTTVSVTVTDQGGQVWKNGTISYVFAPNPSFSGTYQWNGSALPTQYLTPQIVTLNGSGVGSFAVPTSSLITPAGSTWKYVVCPNASSACTVINLASIGSTQNISSQVTAATPAISIQAGPMPLAYTDTEITTTPNQGGIYFNVTSFLPKYFDGGAWQFYGSGGGGGVTFINGVSGSFTFTGSGVSCVGTTCTFSGGGSFPYPGAGIPNSTGSAWGTSFTIGGAGLIVPTETGSFVSGNIAIYTGTVGQIGNGAGIAASNIGLLDASNVWTGTLNNFTHTVSAVSLTDGTCVITLGNINGCSSVTTAALHINITGSTQCLQINTSGLVSGFGAGCGGTGTVTSVAETVPGVLLGISGSPITTSGTLALTLVSQSANTVFGNFTSGSATPTFSNAPVFSAAGLTNIPACGTCITSATTAGGALSGTYPNPLIAGLGATANLIAFSDGAGHLQVNSAYFIDSDGFLNLNTPGINMVSGSAGSGGQTPGIFVENTACPGSPAEVSANIEFTGNNTENAIVIGKQNTCVNSGLASAADISFITVTGANHKTPGTSIYSVTNVSLTSNVVTVTASNSFSAGQFGLIFNLTVSTFLNNQTFTVLTASSTQFTFAFTHANFSATGETGNAEQQIDNQLDIANQGSGIINIGGIVGTPMMSFRSGLAANGIFIPSLSGCLAIDGTTHVMSGSGSACGSGSAGVSSINTVTGAFTFTGTGVSCTSTTCTFTTGTGTVTSIATAGPIGGGPITTAGTITCATCTTNASGLTGNSVVLGANGQATKVLAGFFTDGAGTLTLGVTGTTAGGLQLVNGTSGGITLITPTSGALGSSLATLPINTGTIAELNFAQTWSALQTYSVGINLSGTTSPLQMAGSAGTSGNCLISGGTGVTPSWTTCGGGGSITFPQTVAGTVNSGGIIYASSTTQISVSATNTAGQVVLWGGAGVAPSAKSQAGSGASIVTGPASNTTGDFPIYTGTTGGTVDSAITVADLGRLSQVNSWQQANTFPSVQGGVATSGSLVDGFICYNSANGNNSACGINFQARNSAFGTFKGGEIFMTMLSATSGSEVTSLTIEHWSTSQILDVTFSGTGSTLLAAFAGQVQGKTFGTATNCASAASPAVCGSAAAGAFTIAAAATTVIVNTSAVTANSEIEITPDSSLGTRLSVTCNTSIATVIGPVVTARSAGTSFTVTITGTLVTNPACYTYSITN